jgi:hypothetical protein
MLNEMFGEQFKTVEDFKKANIPEQLKELTNLRQKNQELDALVKAKPKHHFANDDIAKMNEFVRETGIKDVGVFNRLNAADLANMSDIDALMLQHVIDNPRLAGRDPQEVRRYIETKYNVDPAKIDPKKVEAGELTQEELDKNKREFEYNKMELEVNADKAKTKLHELKGKIKMPEPPADEPGSKTKWTPDIEKTQKAGWTKVNERMGEEFAKLPIRIKGGKEPIVNFVIPEETRKVVLTTALDYVVSNQMEINEANVKSVANMMYSELILSNLDEITHAVFERARSMTEDEYLKTYHNPSPKNTDNPPSGGEPLSEEAKKEKAFRAELER